MKDSNATCAWCQESFYRRPSSLAKSKSGLVFCCRKCKDNAQQIGGLEAIQPQHYGTSAKSDCKTYRRLAFIHYPKRCSNPSCNYDKIPEILEINHIDCDRSNNSKENLQVLCPTCHAELHYTTKTGKWRNC